MQVKSIAECSKGSILQYFRPALSYQVSLRSLFCLFLSGCFTQVLCALFINDKVFPYRSFEQLLAYEEDDLEEIFCLHFEVCSLVPLVD